jgi:hypothetical protein
VAQRWLCGYINRKRAKINFYSAFGYDCNLQVTCVIVKGSLALLVSPQKNNGLSTWLWIDQTKVRKEVRNHALSRSLLLS